MKIHLQKILLFGLAGAMLLAACKKSESSSSLLMDREAVSFSASINTIGNGTTPVNEANTLSTGQSQTVPTAANNTWDAGDDIGVYMKQGSGLSTTLAGNKKYTTTGDGSFNPASAADFIFYPINGAPVDFISYYPYQSSLTNNIYKVDVTNQSVQGAIDLLYSTNAINLDKTTPNASLVFTHQLAKLEFVVKNGGGVSSLSGLSANIDGLKTGGSFDLATGVLTVDGQTTTIAAKVTSDTAGMLVEAIIPPAAVVGDATVTFSLPSGKFKWTVPDNTVYAKGKKYAYQIELRNTAAIPVPVMVSATITDWTDVPSGSYVVEDMRVRGTNHQLAVGYFNGIDRIGPEYDLTKVPDRLDIVNIFNQFRPLWELSRDQIHAQGAKQPTLPEILAGVKNLQQRGIKVVETQFLREFMDNYKDVANKVNWTNSQTDYDGFAKALRDTFDIWGIDGIDFDVENEPQCLSKIGYDWQAPNYDQSTWLSTNEQVAYLTAMTKYFGPSATLPIGKPKKLLILDTNLPFSSLGYPKDLLNKFDYIYIQAYGGGFSTANSFTALANGPGLSKNKIMLIAADFESNPKSPNLKNAYTNETSGQTVGGFGAYGFNFDQPDYPVYREMIKTLNPTGE